MTFDPTIGMTDAERRLYRIRRFHQERVEAIRKDESHVRLSGPGRLIIHLVPEGAFYSPSSFKAVELQRVEMCAHLDPPACRKRTHPTRRRTGRVEPVCESPGAMVQQDLRTLHSTRPTLPHSSRSGSVFDKQVGPFWTSITNRSNSRSQ